VLSATATLADFLGIGSHHFPLLYFGPVQTAGLAVGVLVSLLGVVLYWPRAQKKEVDSPEA
jgi:hypothetical protein